MQPHVFVDDRMYGFWGGLVGVPETTRSEMYAALGKKPDDIFPIQVFAAPGLTTGTAEIIIPDWLGRTL